MAMPRDRFQRQSLGALYVKIRQSRVLLVGAGGIGCELLKNLVLTGFGEVHIIDLDTIDLSNLNRQFLFRQEHIKKPKALVAKEVAQTFNPAVQLTAHHANIKDAAFNIEWFSSFALVFNALDNLDARRHVNKMCLAADVPLIESGTTGFNRQLPVIIKGKTACYDCNQKEPPKTFPVCTIRSTPSQPIHCIVWAKSYLLPELFGESEDQIAELDTSEDAGNAEEIAKLRIEAQALSKMRESMGADNFAAQVFDKVFQEDIERLRRMEDMWKLRRPPTPLAYEDFPQQSDEATTTIARVDQRPWTKAENVSVFRHSLARLSQRYLADQADALRSGRAPPAIAFDKDDADTLDLVTAAANLRSLIFGIETKSKFDVKQMAGNIIPAIATTNAMVAGLCVLQSFKVLKGAYGKAKWLFLNRTNLSSQPNEAPNPECQVCTVAVGRVKIDAARATLGDLVGRVLKEDLGYGEEVTVVGQNGLIYDPDMEDNLDKKLGDLGVGDGTWITVQDDEEPDGEGDERIEPRIDLQLVIEVRHDLPDDGEAVVLHRKPDLPRKAKKPAAVTNGEMNGEEENGMNGVDPTTGTGKRKRSADSAELETTASSKRFQATKPTAGGGDAIVLDDAEEGAIEIDSD